MSSLLKHLKSVALGLAAALVVPSGLSASPIAFGFGDYVSDSVLDEPTRVHCCHSHPRSPYDQYCCHPGGTAARTAAGAAVAYGAYRGVRSATKSAYKKGYSNAKKHIKRR